MPALPIPTQIRRAALTTTPAAPTAASRGHSGPSAPALWVFSWATTPKPARISMSAAHLDSAASTASTRGALSAATARRATLLKQTSAHARLQVRKEMCLTLRKKSTKGIFSYDKIGLIICPTVIWLFNTIAHTGMSTFSPLYWMQWAVSEGCLALPDAESVMLPFFFPLQAALISTDKTNNTDVTHWPSLV